MRRFSIARLIAVTVVAALAVGPWPGTQATGSRPPGSRPPVSGVSARLWTAKYTEPLGAVVAVGRELLITHGARIEARGVRSGRLIWSRDLPDDASSDPPDRIWPVAANLAVVSYLHEVPDDDGATETDVFAFDPKTGGGAWIASGGPDGAEPGLVLLGAGRGRVFVYFRDKKAIWAIDAARRAFTWKVPLPAGCDYEDGSADGHVVVVVMRCGSAYRLSALAPADGHRLWERPNPVRGSPVVVMDEGAILVEDDDGYAVLEQDGSTLVAGTLSEDCDCEPVIGRSLVAQIPDGPWPDIELTPIRVVSRPSGATRSSLGDEWAPYASGREIVASAGEIYGLHPPPGRGVTPTLYGLDSRTGRFTLLTTLPPSVQGGLRLVGEGFAVFTEETPSPMPYDGENGVEDDGESVWLKVYGVTPAQGADPGLIHRLGVPASAWPDACALLPAARLAQFVPGVRYRATPVKPPAALMLSRPTECDLESDGETGPPIAITVYGVFPSPDEAHAAWSLITSWSLSYSVRVPDVGDEAFTRDDLDDMVTFRAGSTVVQVDVPGHPDLARKLAQDIVTRLPEGP